MMSMKAGSICLLLTALLHLSNAAPSHAGCPIGTPPVYCLINPCQDASCPAFEDATCVEDYCGGCNARWILDGQEVTDQCGGCLDGSLPVSCLVDPCQYASCPGTPNATCQADYCGGCNARWYLNDQDVTNTCDSEAPCPDGSLPHRCKADPCQVATCPAFGSSDVVCKADYCGGCNARWYLDEEEVTDSCNVEGPCPDGSLPHRCMADPCQVATCPAFGSSDVVCKADYCGGCNARWYLDDEEVTDSCNGSTCPDGSQPINCLVDPCQYSSCPSIPNAKCKADYCGGCNAQWFINNLNVTETCVTVPPRTLPPIDMECSIPGQVYSTCGSACTPTCEVPDPICTKQCVEGCHCPRGTVLHEDVCISLKECPRIGQ